MREESYESNDDARRHDNSLILKIALFIFLFSIRDSPILGTLSEGPWDRGKK
jgi:hypothetical protein